MMMLLLVTYGFTEIYRKYAYTKEQRPQSLAKEWSKRLDACRLSSLIAPDESPFTSAHWTHWIHLIGSRLSQLWTSTRLAELPVVLGLVPQHITATITTPSAAPMLFQSIWTLSLCDL